MVDWTIADGVQLIAYTLFVFWQPFPMKRKEVEWYRNNKDNLWMLARVPAGVFPVVWMCLYVCITAGITLFAKWVDPDPWTWRTVYALFFVNVLTSKAWTWLFFTKRQFMLALMNGIFLALTAVALVICIGIGHEDITGGPYYVPLILFLVYATWLLYAIFLTIAWWVKMPEQGEKPGRFFNEVVTGMTKDQLRMSRAIGHVPVVLAKEK
jgi:tryptophan-rich sensory protein